ncbi:flagellar basal body P-ring formation chaperone FlgA [Frateuria aurantia]
MRLHRWSLPILVRVLMPALAPGLVQAADLQAMAQQAARAVAPADAEIRFEAPSPGMTTSRTCSGQLDHQVVTPRLGPRMEVRFQCRGTSGWVVNVAVPWHVYVPVLVTTRPLARQDAINADTARLERRDITQLGYGYISDPAVLGKRYLARALAEGTVLTPAMLLHQELVRAGDDVMLQVDSGGLEVRAGGTALSGGDQGERVTVKNGSSGRILEAVVVAQGIVEVMP